MRKKMIKLLLSVSVLAGSLMGLTPKTADALSNCPAYYCCDPNCFGIRPCHSAGASCICSAFCQPNLGGGGLD